MASPSSRSGRFTPKGSADSTAKPAANDAKAAKAGTGRYTPPIPKEIAHPETKPWVPWAMFGSLGIGLFMIILNYAEILPGASNNWYLIGGLLFITAGFAAATQLR